jgi:dehydrogenase/reductase SDR family protein 12
MPDFYERMKERLRTAAEGADTVTWLSIAPEVPTKVKGGDFVQDRTAVSKHFPLAWTHHNPNDEQVLWEKLEEYVKLATA